MTTHGCLYIYHEFELADIHYTHAIINTVKKKETVRERETDALCPLYPLS